MPLEFSQCRVTSLDSSLNLFILCNNLEELVHSCSVGRAVSRVEAFDSIAETAVDFIFYSGVPRFRLTQSHVTQFSSLLQPSNC